METMMTCKVLVRSIFPIFNEGIDPEDGQLLRKSLTRK